MRAEALVLDTNVLISAMIQPAGPSGAALRWVLATNDRFLIFSPPTWEDLVTRPARPKFDRYLDPGRRQAFLSELVEATRMVAIRGPPWAVAIPTTTR